MWLSGVHVKGAAKGLGLGLFLSASISLSACASSGLLGAGKLAAVAESSSCTNPVVVKHVLKGENKTSLSANDIPQAERIARVRIMGFKDAVPVPGSGCSGPDVTKYQPAGTDEAPSTYLYIKHMTKAAIKQDPNVRCKPIFTQVYQPPLKLGGAGRVIMVPNGEKCGKSAKIPNMEELNFETLGAQMVTFIACVDYASNDYSRVYIYECTDSSFLRKSVLQGELRAHVSPHLIHEKEKLSLSNKNHPVRISGRVIVDEYCVEKIKKLFEATNDGDSDGDLPRECAGQHTLRIIDVEISPMNAELRGIDR